MSQLSSIWYTTSFKVNKKLTHFKEVLRKRNSNYTNLNKKRLVTPILL